MKAVLALIKRHKLSVSDVIAALGKSRKLDVGKVRLLGKRPKKKAKIKFNDGNGNTWSGRGRTPRQLLAAELAGRKRQDFVV